MKKKPDHTVIFVSFIDSMCVQCEPYKTILETKSMYRKVRVITDKLILMRRKKDK